MFIKYVCSDTLYSLYISYRFLNLWFWNPQLLCFKRFGFFQEVEGHVWLLFIHCKWFLSRLQWVVWRETLTAFKHFVYVWKVVKGLSCICLAREQNPIIYFIHQRWQQNATLWLERVVVLHCLACQCVKMKENDFSGMTSHFSSPSNWNPPFLHACMKNNMSTRKSSGWLCGLFKTAMTNQELWPCSREHIVGHASNKAGEQ